MKIRAYLFLIAAVILIPVIIFAAVALKMLQEFSTTTALHGMQETARTVALTIDRELRSAEAALQVLATSPYLGAGDMAAFYLQARTADRHPNAWTLLLDENGQPVFSTAIPFGAPVPPAPQTKEQVQQVLQTRKTMVSNLMIDPATRHSIAALSVPVQTKNGKRYVLAAIFTSAYFTSLTSNTGIPGKGAVGIIDRNGRFIGRSLNPQQRIGQPARQELVEAARRSNEGHLRHRTLENIDVYDVFTHSPLAGWTVAVATPVGAVMSAAGKAALVAFLGMLAACGFATIVAGWFGRQLIRSIDRAVTAAAALEEGKVPEHLGSRIPELNALHNALHNAGVVLAQEQQLRRKAELEREELLERETEARQRAEEQNQAKDTFIAMLGHELRNPMSAICAGIEVLKTAGPVSAMARRGHEIMERQCKHLVRIVDDLLDAGRMLSGKIVLEKAPVDLGNAATACIEALEAAGRMKDRALSVSVRHAPLNADPTRIDQMINNLLDNAIRYSPAGSRIDVCVTVEGNEALLTVSDTGIGIAPDLLPRVFDPFVQGSRPLHRAQGGLGVGLTLVRKLAELHGGSASAMSKGEGCGSTFSVRLPLSTAQPESPAAGSSAVDGKRSVLVIEDNPDAREMTCIMLEMHGYQVFTAADGEEGIKTAKARKPDVAVIDIGLPDLDGYEVAGQLRADPEIRGTGLIALTGYGTEDDIRRAMSAGFDVHLTKPTDVDRLANAVRVSIAARKHVRSLG